jgi:hypothetical protein
MFFRFDGAAPVACGSPREDATRLCEEPAAIRAQLPSMKGTPAYLLLAIAGLLLPAGAAAQGISEGIAAPKGLTASLDATAVCNVEKSASCTQRVAGGGLGLTFAWGFACDESLCLFPSALQLERNGTIVSTAPMESDLSHPSRALYAVIVDKGGWAPGDCFRIRVAAASDSKKGTYDYSDFSNKSCAPATTPGPSPSP